MHWQRQWLPAGYQDRQRNAPDEREHHKSQHQQTHPAQDYPQGRDPQRTPSLHGPSVPEQQSGPQMQRRRLLQRAHSPSPFRGLYLLPPAVPASLHQVHRQETDSRRQGVRCDAAV